ncbi:UNVERIFIED_CONTAM: Inactive tyrosine-protein kinase prag1, partial [Gekko kuhli]
RTSQKAGYREEEEEAQNEQRHSVHKIQRAVEVKREGSKMSACSDFVEHIWKPGSCQNCFCPRHFHQLQAPPLDLGNSGRLAQDPRGIRARPEPLEDEGVTSLPYSKPTIAVKPTMMNSDISEVWADGNLSADIPQVMINEGCGAFLQDCFRC